MTEERFGDGGISGLQKATQGLGVGKNSGPDNLKLMMDLAGIADQFRRLTEVNVKTLSEIGPNAQGRCLREKDAGSTIQIHNAILITELSLEAIKLQADISLIEIHQLKDRVEKLTAMRASDADADKPAGG